VKAFHFKLEQAVRWREAQVTAQKARVSSAAARLTELEAALDSLRSSLSEAQRDLPHCGKDLQFFAAFGAVTTAHIRDFETQIAQARQSVTLEIKRMVEANQRARVLQNLRSAQHRDWRREFDRELATFADEAFVSRKQG
jgi:chromosome segregation ATPase